MMFLSRLVLNLRSHTVRRDLSDCHEMHRTLLAAFPQAASDAARAEFGVLFRAETTSRTGMASVVVQSQAYPDWSRLPQDYLLAVANNSACKSIDEAYGVLRAGMHLAFRLRANPTRKIETKSLPDGTKRNGKRVELYREEDRIAWFRRKADAAGFRLLTVRVNPDVPNLHAMPEAKTTGWRSDSKGADRGSKRLTFGSVLFEGVLEITDADLFRQALANGIGPGKAYGFGLLSIAPA